MDLGKRKSFLLLCPLFLSIQPAMASRVDCSVQLQGCGYTVESARKATGKLVKSGVLPGRMVSREQLISALRALGAKRSPRCSRELELYEARKMMINDLQSESASTTGSESTGSPARRQSDADDSEEPDSPIEGDQESAPLSSEVQTQPLDGLAQITDADTSRIRRTSETPPRVSIYDVIATTFGMKNPHDSWLSLCREHNEVLGLTENFKFPGRGQRDTPVTDAKGIVQIIMLLPSRAAAPIRAKAADVLVRYLGGDSSLVPEIQANRERQEHLAQEQPDHPARIFGEAVESRVPPSPICFNEAPRMRGASHHYILRSQAYPGLFKTGSSKDPQQRLQSEERRHSGQLKLVLHGYLVQRGRAGTSGTPLSAAAAARRVAHPRHGVPHNKLSRDCRCSQSRPCKPSLGSSIR